MNEHIDYLITSVVHFAHTLGFKNINELHQKWFDLFFSDKDEITLQASRNSYKTTLLAIFVAIYMVLYPNKRILIIRKTDDDIADFIGTVENILMSTNLTYHVRKIYNKELDIIESNASEITTNLKKSTDDTAQLRGKSLNSALTGKHADLIITDDIITMSDRISKADREKTKLKYQELHNLLNRDGKIINAGTPWHKDDCFQLMKNIHKFNCYDLEKAKVMTKEHIANKRSRMTSSLFAANYELKHIADEDAMFTSPIYTTNLKLIENGICHIDASYGGGDNTAFTIIKKVDDKLYVFGKRFEKHVDDCLDDILELKQLYKGGSIDTESNADKGYLAKEIRKRGGNANQPYHESMNKFIKISTYLKNRWLDVIFLNTTDPEYINEILDYTEQAEHDDCPDSLASLIRKITEKGIPKVMKKPIGL